MREEWGGRERRGREKIKGERGTDGGEVARGMGIGEEGGWGKGVKGEGEKDKGG